MANEILTFDATGSNPDGTDPGTALNIGPGTDYVLRELSVPAPPQTVQYAGSVDTEGSSPASRKHENRVIAFKVLCATAAALRTLQSKIGKIAVEGGTLKWVLPNAETVIFDLHSADSFEPAIDKMHYVRAGAFCEVQIVLTAEPYGRGSEITLTDHTETSSFALVFTETGLKGDIPGRARLVIDEDQAKAQTDVLWGIQSQYYSAAATAALTYEAETLTPTGSGTLAVGPAGASGGGSNVIKNTVAGGGAGSWNDTLTTQAAGGGADKTHAGDFSVWARVFAPATNAGSTSIRLGWSQADLRLTVTNDAVSLDGAINGFWQWVDLGQILIRKAIKGNQLWRGTIQVNGSTVADLLHIDAIFLVPLDLSGHASSVTASSPALPASASVEIRSDSAIRSASNGGWGAFPVYEGDYMFIPPAGLEARTLRVIVKMFHAVDVVAAAGDTIDDLSARLSYTPRYLVVPSP